MQSQYRLLTRLQLAAVADAAVPAGAMPLDEVVDKRVAAFAAVRGDDVPDHDDSHSLARTMTSWTIARAALSPPVA